MQVRCQCAHRQEPHRPRIARKLEGDHLIIAWDYFATLLSVIIGLFRCAPAAMRIRTFELALCISHLPGTRFSSICTLLRVIVYCYDVLLATQGWSTFR